MVKAANRRVTFLPHCQVRVFGNTDVESDGGNPSTLESMGYTAKWLDTVPQTPTPIFNWDHINDPDHNILDVSKVALDRTRIFPSGESPQVRPKLRPLRRQQGQVPLTSRSQQRLLQATQVRPVSKKGTPKDVRNKKREDHLKQREALAKWLKKHHGVMWTRPKALRKVRRDWRFSDEFESDGANPGDNESDLSTPNVQRTKKMLTIKERFERQVVHAKLVEEKRQEEMRKERGKKALLNFIEKTKAGIHLRSIASKDNENLSKCSFAFYSEARSMYVEKINPKDPRKTYFQLRRCINNRLENSNVDETVKVMYRVVLENYDPILGPHFLYLFEHDKLPRFAELEKMFLLNH